MGSPTISKVHGREVLDSRGNPTLEVELTLSDGAWGRGIVPSGASKGLREALELRDGDKARYLGKGVLKSVDYVSTKIGPAILGKSPRSPQEMDSLLLELDPSPQKEKLGANTLLGVSMAFAHALAASRKQPLYQLIHQAMGDSAKTLAMPIPLMNILNGGLHANNGLAIQEFMIVPHGFSSFGEALRAGCEVFHTLKSKLHQSHLSTGVGDEGGFAPELKSNDEALEWIVAAIKEAGYRLGDQIAVALDVAASSFYDEEKGTYKLGEGKDLSQADMIEYLASLAKKFPIISIEDGLFEDDWQGWLRLTQRLGGQLQLVGDDLFVTQTRHLKKGIEEKIANAILIKVNQVGTLKETFETMGLAKAARFGAVVSHRSGETEDVTIAHLAVGSGCGMIKTGSASRSERMAKYNELLRIEENAKREGKPLALAKWRA